MAAIAAPTRQELIPGYFAIDRLGAGGYGEVWKVEAPGGLHKAVKVVYGYHCDERATRELKALDHIRAVRHPFILSLERIEVVDSRLMIVTELADMSLMDRFEQCRKTNLPGIPRDELLGCLRDAADALDFMLQTHSLQHLDVKPENMLLVAGRTKIADFGLVKEIADKTRSLVGAMTPTYAAPEVFDGRASRHSDQYSLAIVYQEMLTGVLPFPGRTAAQLAAQHTRARPQLSALPAADRDIIARALAKRGDERFPSCRELIDALCQAQRCPSPVGDPLQQVKKEAGTRAMGLDDTRVTDAPEQRTEIVAAPLSHATGKLSAARPIARLEVQVDASTRSLPPPEYDPALPGLRPALFIGMGGTGGRVLASLRQRLAARFGEELLPAAFPMLLIETDTKGVKQAAQAGFDPQDGVLLGLKQSHEYRGESEQLLQWISRRWLYNIPKSAETNGIRPYGRLALIDRGGQMMAKLRPRLKPLLQSDCRQALAAAEQVELPNSKPRIYLVASCCGGTGGGMLLEMAYAVRNLARHQSAEVELCAIVTTTSHACGAAKQLATANTLAFLAELQHYARSGAQGAGSTGACSALCEGPDFPLDHVYFLNLPGDASLEPIADYLYGDVATSLGLALDACRQPQPEAEMHIDLELRSFQVHRIAAEEQSLVELAPSDHAAEPQAIWRVPAAAVAAHIAERAEHRYPFGCGRRSFLVTPREFERSALAPVAKAIAAVVDGTDDDALYCEELAAVSLAQHFQLLCDQDPQAMAAVEHLHTRTDIDWTLPARIVP